MFWEIQKDFLSLFRRGTGCNNYLNSIDGLRSLANLSIVFVHLLIIYTAFVLPYPNKQWQELLMSSAFGLNNVMIFALEIFFMLSGFLLTYKLLNHWNRFSYNKQSFLYKEYPISILKRIFRFWPGILLAFVMLFVFGEPLYPNAGYLFEFFRQINIWMFFQNYIDPDYWYTSLAPLWSISLDMQMHILLPLVLFIFYSKKNLSFIYNCLIGLLIVSVIRGLIVYDSSRMAVGIIGVRYPSFLLLTPSYFLHWVESNYNLTLSFDLQKDDAATAFSQAMYLPLEARFGSFIIGAMLAIQILRSQKHSNERKTWKKYLFYFLIVFQILAMFPNPNELPPDNFVTTFALSATRQIFTIGQAFILFTALCPLTHPYHSSWLRKFFSLNIWIPISKLSYLVYIIHWRIAFELVFRGPLRFKQYSVTHASLIALPIVLVVSQIVAAIWYVLVEKPFERAVTFYVFNRKSSQQHTL